MTNTQKESEKQTINNWVRCCDRLPEPPKGPQPPKLVEAVSSKGQHFIVMGVFTGKKWKIFDIKRWQMRSHRVVAWMDLPEPSMTEVWENVK